jgi:hypothetical protein
MCHLCVEIDKKVERYREELRSVTDETEVERINRLIAQLYADRVRLHQNSEETDSHRLEVASVATRPQS